MPILYLARHATPDWDRKDIRYDVPPGPPLVPQGEQEAAQLAAWLADRGLARIVTSPLLRAQQTAAIVAGRLGLPVTVAPELAEKRREETREEVVARMERFYREWLSNGAETILAVSHGYPIEMLLRTLGVPESELAALRGRFDHNNPVPCAGVWQIEPVAAMPLCALAFMPKGG
ncbi:MAG: phosphoglycerate mutase family protein [Anaerolineae bacterium]|nr:histidine phosphatase family protein [Caldilineales bacterium]MCX7853114.1 histidine phosphatase family protein [Caldilineales bacterium]MDW8267760.1 phosphoglycerate mutase family protein [Anaerolineae bacterium]